MSHYLNCPAPICAGYDTEGIVWYPEEPVCAKTPTTHWQRVQRRIQKLFLQGKLKYYSYFTKEILEKKTNIHPGVKGIVSDSLADYTLHAKNGLIHA